MLSSLVGSQAPGPEDALYPVDAQDFSVAICKFSQYWIRPRDARFLVLSLDMLKCGALRDLAGLPCPC